MKPRRLQRPTMSSMRALLDAGTVIRRRTMGFGGCGVKAWFIPAQIGHCILYRKLPESSGKCSSNRVPRTEVATACPAWLACRGDAALGRTLCVFTRRTQAVRAGLPPAVTILWHNCLFSAPLFCTGAISGGGGWPA